MADREWALNLSGKRQADGEPARGLSPRHPGDRAMQAQRRGCLSEVIGESAVTERILGLTLGSLGWAADRSALGKPTEQ